MSGSPNCGPSGSVLPGAQGDLFLKHHFIKRAPWGHLSLASLASRVWIDVIPGLSQGHMALDLAIHAFSALSYAILASRPRTDAYIYMDHALQVVKTQPHSYDFADVATIILCAHFENLSGDNGRESAMVHVNAAGEIFAAHALDETSSIGLALLHDIQSLRLEAAVFSTAVVKMSTSDMNGNLGVYDTLGVLVANTWNALKVPASVPLDKLVPLRARLQQWIINLNTPDTTSMVQCIALGHWHTAMLQLDILLCHQRDLAHAHAVLSSAEALCMNPNYRPLHHTNVGIVWPLFTSAILAEDRTVQEASVGMLRRIGREGFHDGDELSMMLEDEMQQWGSLRVSRERCRKLILHSLQKH